MPKETLEEFAFPGYWDKRYLEEIKRSTNLKEATVESFEWFKTFEKLRPFFSKHLLPPPNTCHILHLGCGNSTLTADLHQLGYSNQTSIDFSEVIIEAMEEKYKSLNTTWKVMDVRDIKLEDGGVDVAIDKGTLDAMLHGSLWDPPDDVRESVGKYVDEVARVLKPGAQWLYITYRQPHFLKPLLAREGIWDMEVEILGESGGTLAYCGFIMKKR